ncbi:MAG: T9SS type A sorting domain-containing protein [Bacteroidetes bacterium]|nr:T9SS type A sorting domain-containing protein [Bacteroidota bacterium]
MNKFYAFLLPVILMLLPTLTNGQGSSFDDCPDGTEIIGLTYADLEKDLFTKLNALRLDSGRGPLKRQYMLDRAARYHAQDEVDDDYFGHETQDRDGNNDLVIICSAPIRLAKFFTYFDQKEVLALGWEFADSVIYGVNGTGWISSTTHRNAILNPAMKEIGIGIRFGHSTIYGGDAHQWVANLAQNTSNYPMIINRDSASTASLNVRLFFYVVGPWDSVRLRNDGEDFGAWQVAEVNKTWTLRNATGLRTVFAEYKNSTDTYEYMDEICFGNPCSMRPLAADDYTDTNEDMAVSVNVLDNDVDYDGDNLTMSIVTNAANGTSTDAGSGSINYVPNTGYIGLDTVIYSACDATTCDTATFIISTNLTGIDSKVSENLSISVYPNPTSGDTEVSFKISQTQNVDISLHNLLGEQLFSSNQSEVYRGSSRKVKIPTAELPNGMYLLMIKGEGFVHSEKIVVSR